MAYRRTTNAPAPRATRDLTTQAGAETLAAELNAWWHRRGYTNVQHWAEWLAFARKRGDQLGRSSGTWVVRSNLINGMPHAEAYT
jgi:hypothetical protein